jgi:hypothetical protein
MLASLPVTDFLKAPHGRSFWPWTPIPVHQWLLLAITGYQSPSTQNRGTKAKSMLRSTCGLPDCLSVKPLSGAKELFSLSVACLLTRERVYRLKLLVVLANKFTCPWALRPYFIVSDLRITWPREPGPCIYIPKEQGGPVIPSSTGFSFRRLLRLAGRYSNPPQQVWVPVYSLGTNHMQTAASNNFSTRLYLCVSAVA